MLDGADVTRTSEGRCGVGAAGPTGVAPLTVAEHIALAGGRRRGTWTADVVLDLLPRLAER